jgi:hypothetical protein
MAAPKPKTTLAKRDLKDELNRRFARAKEMMRATPPRIPQKGGGRK